MDQTVMDVYLVDEHGQPVVNEHGQALQPVLGNHSSLIHVRRVTAYDSRVLKVGVINHDIRQTARMNLVEIQ
jgi:hypothetical protein